MTREKYKGYKERREDVIKLAIMRGPIRVPSWVEGFVLGHS